MNDDAKKAESADPAEGETETTAETAPEVAPETAPQAAPETASETAAATEPASADTDPATEAPAESGWAGGADAARIAEIEAENADVKNRLLRLAADMENLRRRTEKDVRDASQYAIAKFARDVLTVGDNLSRAIEAVPAETREAADSVLKGLIEGVEMTERELVNALGRHNITRIDPAGEKFDPNAHEAVFQVPDPSVPSGMVSQVVQPGYRIGERVLRPAMVGVSAGGPKAPPEEPEAPAEPGSTVDKTA
jgi:molecular chaperone GrpE